LDFTGRFSRLQTALWLFILVAAPLAGRAETLPVVSPGEQRHDAAAAAHHTISALMVSDIHFDPFHDPALAQQLVNEPVSRWTAILSAPPSPNQQQTFNALQSGCSARGVDTPYALLNSSLQAMRRLQPQVKFMLVSGDLLAHEFSCRYTKLFPVAKGNDYQLFVLKTMSFVVQELRATIPGIPVYVALGNNDSACGDYRLDAGSDFLAQAGRIIAEGLPSSKRQQALRAFARGGYYSLMMAAPMRDTRLIVLNDIFQSPKYQTCGGKADDAAGADEMAWMRKQLTEAQRLRQKVWVMGHIPPGVDPFATVLKFADVCGKGTPEMFQASDKMTDLLTEHAGVIRLGIFAHTHMDEMRLFHPQNGAEHSAHEQAVAIKIIPSISPVDGNNPSFTIADVNPASALLQDYQVIAASNQTGIDTTWSKEYDYAQAYHEAQFSPPTLKDLVAGFENDRGATSAASQQYIRDYYVGDRSRELAPFWPQYVCALANYTAKAFAGCWCPVPR
jgi:sphingomyelin phosphodiesterase acid-like 3